MITSTDQTLVTKAQGDKVTLMCRFSLTSQDEGQLDIEWVMVQPDTEQTVSKNLEFLASFLFLT